MSSFKRGGLLFFGNYETQRADDKEEGEAKPTMVSPSKGTG